MAEAKKLKQIMAAHGVKCSLELQSGRPWSGDDWFTRKQAIMNHHTAGSAKGLTPSLALVKKGRSNLPGPLCNGYGGRDHVYRVITLGLANHPGQGGPLTLAGVRIPKDSARVSVWGTEWEHDGVSAWDGDMQEFMGRSNAALLEWLDRPVEASIEHNTWAPKRKIDRNGYTARTGQDEIRHWSKPQPKPVPAPRKQEVDVDNPPRFIGIAPDDRAFLCGGVYKRYIDDPADLEAARKELQLPEKKLSSRVLDLFATIP